VRVIPSLFFPAGLAAGSCSADRLIVSNYLSAKKSEVSRRFLPIKRACEIDNLCLYTPLARLSRSKPPNRKLRAADFLSEFGQQVIRPHCPNKRALTFLAACRFPRPALVKGGNPETNS
jgi:hypothetical protein